MFEACCRVFHMMCLGLPWEAQAPWQGVGYIRSQLLSSVSLQFVAGPNKRITEIQQVHQSKYYHE